MSDAHRFAATYVDTMKRMQAALPVVEGRVNRAFLDQLAPPVAIKRSGLSSALLDTRIKLWTLRENLHHWHYQQLFRLLVNGRRMFGDRVASVVDDPEICRTLPEDSLVHVWKRDEIVRQYDEAAKAAPSRGALLTALNKRGIPIR